MKSRLLLITTLLLLSIVSGRAQGTVIELDGLTYKIQNGEAALVWGPLCYDVETEEFIDPVPKVVIPEKVIGYNVTTINFNPYCDTLVIPKTVRIIDVKTTYNGMDNPNYGGWDVDDAFGAKYVDCKIENPGSKFNIYDLFYAEVKSDSWKNGSAHSWLKVPKGFESNYPNYGAGSHPIMIYSEEMVADGVIYRVNWSDQTAIIAGYTSDFATGAGVTYTLPQGFYTNDGSNFTVVGIDVSPDVETLILPEDPSHKMKFLRESQCAALKNLIVPEGLQHVYLWSTYSGNGPNLHLHSFIFTPKVEFGYTNEVQADEIWYYGTYNEYSHQIFGEGENYVPMIASVMYVPSTEMANFQEGLDGVEGIEICPIPSDHATIDSWTNGLIYQIYSYEEGTFAKVTGYSGTKPENLFIPDEYNGYLVHRIDDNAFKNNTTIKTVTIPFTIREIGASAFQGCTSLEKVNLYSNFELAIEESAFEGCNALQKIESPYEPPTTFASRAFYGTTSLTSVEVTTDNYIGSEAFAYSGIKQIPAQFLADEIEIGARAFKGSNIEETWLMGTNIIGESAFEDCAMLTNVILEGFGPEGGIELQIGNKAFYNCGNLAKVTLYNNPTSVGSHAFGYCSKLKFIDLNPTPEATYTTDLGVYMFDHCSELKSITFPYKVQVPTNLSTISSNLLSSLELVNLPMSWSGNAIFTGTSPTVTLVSLASNPSGLNSSSFNENTYHNATVTIPKGSLNIYKNRNGWREFWNFVEIDYTAPKIIVNGVKYLIDLDENYAYVAGFEEHVVGTTTDDEGNEIPVYDVRDDLVLQTTLTWEDTTYPVTKIADEAFKDCHILKKVTIPTSYISIGENAFTGSTLEEVVLDCPLNDQGRTNWYRDRYGWNSEGYGTVLQASHTSTSPFYHSECLTKAVLTEECGTEVPAFLFWGATALKDVTLPEGITNIADEAFAFTAIEEINLPQSLTTLGRYSLADTPLKSLTLPEGLTTFEKGNLWLNKVEYIYFPGTVTEISGALSGAHELRKVEFAPNSPITELPTYFCSEMDKLEEVILPPGLTNIPYCCFNRCNYLKTITLPETVETIDDRAFYNCYNITDLKMPKSLKSVGEEAFYGVNLHSLTLPATLETVGEGGFRIGYTYKNGKYRLHFDNLVCFATTPPDLGGNHLVKFTSYGNERPQIVPVLWVPQGSKELYEEAWGEEFPDIRELGGDNDYCLSTPRATTPRGTTVGLPVSMFNIENTTGLMFDMTLPESVELLQNGNGDYLAYLTDRFSDHQLIISQLPNGDYRFIIISFSSQNITGNDGNILNLRLDIPFDASPGEYEIQIHDVSIVAPDGNEIEGHYPIESSSILELLNKLMGDVNANKKIGLDDAICIINHVNGRTPGTFDTTVADFNDDGDITLADVIKLISVLKYIQHSPAQPADTDDALRIQRSDDGFDIILDNARDYTALTLDMALPAGATIEGIAADAARCKGHQVEVSSLDNGTTRVILYSIAGTTLKGNDGRLLHVTTGTAPVDVTLNNIEAVTPTAEAYTLAAVNGYATGIKALRSAMTVTTDGNTFVITTDRATEVTVCGADGRMLRRHTLTPGTHTLSGFAPGVYLVNNEKYVVK